MSNDEVPKWVDDMLTDALKDAGKLSDQDQWYRAFRAIIQAVREGNHPAYFSGIAGLTTATWALSCSCHDEGLPTEEESRELKMLIEALDKLLSRRAFNYLPAIMASYLLRKYRD